MRTIALTAALLAALLPALDGGTPSPTDRANMPIQSITPILYVDAIEPVLPFWIDRLGYELVSEVREDDLLGFAILQKDGTEVMVQTRASMAADIPAIAETPVGSAILFVKVESLDLIIEAMDGVEVVEPRRITSYGADEIFVREPGGNIIGFAAF